MCLSLLKFYVMVIIFLKFPIDPAMILQDPLARDQDNADLISDSIQNQGHQWRNKLMP